MIRKFRFGSPMETDSVVKKQPESPVSELFLHREGKVFSYDLSPKEIVYGLGQNVRGINKRGWLYKSMNADDPQHTESKHALYGSHNFLILSGEKQVGLFFDTPEVITWDIGYTDNTKMTVEVENGNVDVYVIEGNSPDEIVHEFREMIGRSYIPPKWAFGYGQCRWSYMSSDEVREIVKKHREAGTPIDLLYLDIDYMDGYRDFTTNPESFPDFDELVAEMKKEHVHLVPIIDAGVKIDPDYQVYQEGRDRNYFCKDANGNDFVVGVWPGDCCFPDFLNEDARKWFGHWYKALLDRGIDAFWNDMNEPAIFYEKNILQDYFKTVRSYEGKELDVDTFFEVKGLVNSMLDGNENVYKLFYHNIDGKKVNHRDVHNLFGYYMTRSASEAFDELVPDKRVLMFSRSSYVGMHRYGGIWQGDNLSWWSHILMNLKMMPSLNMCGFLYTGADTGGFGEDATEDLVLRWLSLSVFLPLLRNHSCRGTRYQEVFRFRNEPLSRGVIKLRYRLIPYLYSEFMKAAVRSTMMYRPLGFVYGNDPIAREVEDQMLIGDELMIAPIYTQNTTGRTVYLPEPMMMLHFTGDKLTEKKALQKGHHYIEMPEGDVVFFLRENRQFVLAPEGMEFVENVPAESLEVISFGEAPVPYELYEDDGEEKDYGEEHIRKL